MTRYTPAQLADAANLSLDRGAPKVSPDSDAEQIARWLQWCDPNGSHTADLATTEGAEPYDLPRAWAALESMLTDEGREGLRPLRWGGLDANALHWIDCMHTGVALAAMTDSSCDAIDVLRLRGVIVMLTDRTFVPAVMADDAAARIAASHRLTVEIATSIDYLTRHGAPYSVVAAWRRALEIRNGAE